MRKAEMDVTSFANPISMLPDRGLVLECEEDENDLAEAVVDEGNDLFELLQTGVAMSDAPEGLDLSSDPLKAFDFIDRDHDAAIDRKELHSIVELALPGVTDKIMDDLFRQIDTDGSGSISVGEFKAWWGRRLESGADVMLDAHTIALRKIKQGRMLSPHSKFRKRWDVVQMILLVYVSIMVSYRVCFDHPAELWGGWFFCDLFIDLYFITDVSSLTILLPILIHHGVSRRRGQLSHALVLPVQLVVNFRTAVITDDGDLLYEQKEVTRHYLKGWFAVDFISCLPFGYFEIAYDGDENIFEHPETARLLKLFRLLKLLRLVRMKRILDRWEEELYSISTVKFAKLMCLIAIASHWLSCSWFYVGCPQLGEAQTGWVVRQHPDYQTIDKGTLYAESMFYASMAVVMVGTDDPEGYKYPRSTSEKAMYAFSFLVGAVVMSLIIGNMSDIIAHSHPGQTLQNEALGVVHAFMHDRTVPGHLTRRVRNHFGIYYAGRGTTVDMYSIFEKMPSDLQIELATQLRFIQDKQTGIHGMFDKIPFFSDLEPSDLILLGTRMRHQHSFAPSFAPDGTVVSGCIMKEGDRGKDMWIISEGRVRVDRSSDQPGGAPVCVGNLRVNDALGELAVRNQQ